MTYPTRKADIKTTMLPDGTVVLFDGSTDIAHTVNPVAAIVWEFCDGTNTVGDIVKRTEELVGQLEAAVDQAEIAQLIETLFQEGLLVDSADPG